MFPIPKDLNHLESPFAERASSDGGVGRIRECSRLLPIHLGGGCFAHRGGRRRLIEIRYIRCAMRVIPQNGCISGVATMRFFRLSSYGASCI